MITVTMYQVKDGSLFASYPEATAYEMLCERVEEALAMLAPRTEVEGAFVQQAPSTFIAVQRRLVDLYAPNGGDVHTEWARKANTPAGQTLIGRYIDDSGNRPIRAAWSRILCTDQHFREWSQPYYAIQADKRADSAEGSP